MQLDILTIIESAASEIRGLRSNAESNKLMLHNITIRLAIHQLRHGIIDYKQHTDEEWNALLAFVEAGRLVISSSGEIYLDMKDLTPEVFLAAMGGGSGNAKSGRKQYNDGTLRPPKGDAQ